MRQQVRLSVPSVLLWKSRKSFLRSVVRREQTQDMPHQSLPAASAEAAEAYLPAEPGVQHMRVIHKKS